MGSGVWGCRTVALTLVLLCCSSHVLYGVDKEDVIKGPTLSPILGSPGALSLYAVCCMLEGWGSCVLRA